MKLLLIIRILLSPILLPLSLVFGFLVLLKRSVQKPKVILIQKVISVGNIQVGGTGKTPVVEILCEHFKEKAVVISKAYKVNKPSNQPQEVHVASDPQVVGDEALHIKIKFPDSKVFSGPIKSQTAAFASQMITKDSVLIIDDGAQHLRLMRDLDVIVWDMSRTLLDFLPFPLGLSREFWFTSIKSRVDILNRCEVGKNQINKKIFLPKNSLISDYEILNISNTDSLSGEIKLISGIGNFKQLRKQVEVYLNGLNKKIDECIEGKDHDDFSWFTPEQGVNYITTHKDYVKLKAIVDEDKLHVVESSFSANFKKSFLIRINSFLNT